MSDPRLQRKQTRLSWWREELELLGQCLAPHRLFALAIVLGGLAGLLVLGYQFPPSSYYVEVGGVGDTPNIRNFHAPQFEQQTQLTYRWTDQYSYVDIPGLGGNLPYSLSLRLDPTHAASRQPVTLTLLVGGQQVFDGALQPGWQTLTYFVNQPAALAARDFALELRSSTYVDASSRSNERLGVKLDWVRVTPQAAGFVQPTLGVLLRLLAFVAIFYLLANRFVSLLFGIGRFDEYIALGITIAAALVVAGLLLFAHAGVVLAATHLLLTAAASYVVLIASRLILAWIQQREPISERATVTRSGAILAALLSLAFAVKFGGMALPQTIVKDMDWHLRFIRELKAGGLGRLLEPGVLSVTPGEWGLGSDALIPKSPLFYVALWPLAYLPGSLETWVKLLICLLDISGAVILYFVANRVGLGRRAGLCAALVYLLTPLSYRVLSFGTLPTIFAQWLTLIAFTYLALHVQELHRPRVLAIQTLLLTLVLLSFPTMVIFTPLVLAVTWVAGALGSRDRLSRRNFALYLPLTGLLAAGLATIIYYRAYLPSLLDTTIPTLLKGTTVRGALPGAQKGGWLGLLLDNVNFYGSWLPLIFAGVGLALLWRGRGSASQVDGDVSPVGEDKSQNLKYLLLGWLLILPLFYFVNYRVDMIGKHLLYVIYPLALAAGVGLAALWLRGKQAQRVVIASFLLLGFSAMALWLDRIVNGGR